jgi:hypothetical protein
MWIHADPDPQPCQRELNNWRGWRKGKRYLEYGGHLGVEVSQRGAPDQVGHHQAQQVRPAHQLHRVVAQQVGTAQSGHCFMARSVLLL